MAAKVSIVILTWNQYSLTRECLLSLFRSSYSEQEIILVDNGSSDSTVEKLADEFGDKVRFIKLATNTGFCAGNNAGIRAALLNSPDYLMILNNDTVVPENALSEMVRILEETPNYAILTPKIVFYAHPERIWAAGGQVNWLSGVAANRGYNRPDSEYTSSGPVDYATGCCFLARREVFEAVGMFDESLFIYFDDLDWSTRAKRAGYQIFYAAGIKILHVAGAALKTDHKKTRRTKPLVYYLKGRNNVLMLKRYNRGVKLWISLAIFFLRDVLLYSVVFLFLARWKKLAAVWDGAGDGLAGSPPALEKYR